MCLRCDGMSSEEIRAVQLGLIERNGWMVQFVEGDARHEPWGYTVGLTRYHDHPELLVSGLSPDVTVELLNWLGHVVAVHERLVEGMVIEGDDGVRILLAGVDDPTCMVTAQEIYNPDGARLVPGLQAVWSDEHGNWPWQTGWHLGARQRLFASPPQAA
ncbi:DUF4262 domain-containing protein [Georgenia deserti]|uniref:DUF4262 domain-containing protein n=1 Tax=Georgenia deserti TaxID=2093781 RepID=A0ABW4L1Z9_9MICO